MFLTKDTVDWLDTYLGLISNELRGAVDAIRNWMQYPDYENDAEVIATGQDLIDVRIGCLQQKIESLVNPKTGGETIVRP